MDPYAHGPDETAYGATTWDGARLVGPRLAPDHHRTVNHRSELLTYKTQVSRCTFAYMDVAISTIRAELSTWIERARAGEEVVVTDRGTPVGRQLRSTPLRCSTSSSGVGYRANPGVMIGPLRVASLGHSQVAR